MDLEKVVLSERADWDRHVSQIRADLSARSLSIARSIHIDREDLVKLSYALGELIAPGRDEPLVTEIVTTADSGESEIPLHNDKIYWRVPPRYLLLYTSERAHVRGGHIIVANLSDAFAGLPEEEREVLCRAECSIASPKNRDPGHIRARLVNRVNDTTLFFRFRTDLIADAVDVMQRWYEVAADASTTLSLEGGDLLVLDNWIMAHGRQRGQFALNGRRVALRTLVV